MAGPSIISSYNEDEEEKNITVPTPIDTGRASPIIESINKSDESLLNNPVDPVADIIEAEDKVQDSEKSPTILDRPQELITAVGEGAALAIGETAQFFSETGEAIEDYFNVGRVVFKDNPDSFLPLIEYWDRERVRKEGLKDSIIGAVEHISETAEEAIPDTETVIGSFVEGMAQFGTNFLLTRRATGIKGIKGGFVNGAIADATAFDPYDENISSLIEEFPFLKNPLTEALATDEDANAFRNRIRNASEGLIIGGALESVVNLYKFTRSSRKAKEEIITEGEASKETLQEVEQAAQDIELQNNPLKKEADDFLKRKRGEKVDPPSSMPDPEIPRQERVKRKKKYDINRARANTKIEADEQVALSNAVAARNQGVAQQLIEEFEQRLVADGMTITKVSRIEDGVVVIDPKLARDVSKERLEKIATVKKKPFRDLLFGVGESQLNTTDALNLSMSEGEMFSAILKPEKFNSIVSVAADLRAKDMREGLGIWDDNNRVIDNLFNLTVQDELIGGQELLDTLAKYGLTFEDYVLTVVGSGSEAGKVLNKLSQIKRARPLTQREAIKQKKLLEQQGRIRDTIMRVENIRRGMMVSQLATASRNLISGAIRAPMEVIGKVMDNALVGFENGGLAGMGKSLIPGNGTWSGSFRHLGLMFTTQRSAKAYTQMIMNQPELVENVDRFYNQMADLQKRMGRGDAKSTAGKVVDYAVSRGEDAAYFMNVPNRWQEFMLRNGMFLADMERLVKRDWGIDLIEAINEGKIRDIMTDASSVRPEGSRSIIDIADESMYNALDLTYANEPDIPLFRSLNTFIVRNGLTTVLPFPRFMFKSMELLAQYGLGASIPVTRFMAKAFKKSGDIRESIAKELDIKVEDVTDEMVSRERRAFSRKERDMIGKNIQGAALIGAGIWYRAQEDAPADYTKMNADDGSVIDTTPLFPLRPLLLIGEMVKQENNNTLRRWIENNPNEIVEVLTGTNYRTGASGYILDDIVSSVFGDGEINATNVKKSGAALGNYFSTFIVPYAQLIDAARVGGYMNNEYLDNAEEPTLDKSASFVDNFTRPFKQRYSFNEDLPTREFVLSETAERKRVAARLFSGLNFYNSDPEYADYLKRKGYTEFKISGYSQSPMQKRMMNSNLRQWLKIQVPNLQRAEERARSRYERIDPERKQYKTFDQYFDATVLSKFDEKLREKKSKLRKQTAAKLEEETKAYLDYNRLPRAIRRRAEVYYETEYPNAKLDEDGEADLSDIETIKVINSIGQKLR